MNAFILAFYRFLVLPFAIVLLPFASLFNRKIREGFALRRKPWEALTTNVRPLWIHAASGEFEYAKALIREFKSLRPHVPVVVTYFSPTFAASAASFPGVERAIALPVDLPGPCQSFLKRLNPQLLLIARTDLWPEMMAQARRRGVPTQLFSYTQKAFTSGFKRWFAGWILRGIDHVYCVAESDRNHLSAIHVHAEVLGDTRYDQVAHRLQNPKAIAAELHPSDETPVFVAGSTWAEDEAVLLPALAEHLRAGRLKLVLVPHEPTPSHIAALKNQLAKLDIRFSLFSAKKNWDASAVLLVDQVGFLAELYLWGDIAFVGGSFRKSVHSVMEALGAGCYTFVGPLHTNNREAIEFAALKFGDSHLDAGSGVEVVRDSVGLAAKVDRLLANQNVLETHRTAQLTEFGRRLGASKVLALRVASTYFLSSG